MGKVISMPGQVVRGRPKGHTAPAHLSAVAKAEWKRVAAILAERGDLGPDVLGTLEQYVTHFARWREAEGHVAESGPVVPAPKTGVLMHSPWLTVANRASDALLKFARALKITPATRPAPQKDDDGDWNDSGLLA